MWRLSTWVLKLHPLRTTGGSNSRNPVKEAPAWSLLAGLPLQPVGRCAANSWWKVNEVALAVIARPLVQPYYAAFNSDELALPPRCPPPCTAAFSFSAVEAACFSEKMHPAFSLQRAHAASLNPHKRMILAAANYWDALFSTDCSIYSNLGTICVFYIESFFFPLARSNFSTFFFSLFNV